MSEPSTELEAAGVAMDGLFVLMKTLGTYDAGHPSSLRAAQDAAKAIEEAAPPFSLQFVGGGAFRDRALIPLTIARFLRLKSFSVVLENLEVHELSFMGGTRPAELLRFGLGLAKARNGKGKHLDGVQVDGVQWRAIANAAWGVEGEEVDPEIFTAAQVALSILDAERVAEADPTVWHWSRAFHVIRRLEQALKEDRFAAARAMEVAPGRWTPARRAVSAALGVMSALAGVGVSSPIQRSTGHATFALALQGFDVQSGRRLNEAAVPLFDRLVQTKFGARSGVEPHRLRVCAIIHQFASTEEHDRDRWMLAMQLIQVAYEMERRRCPREVDFALSKADTLAAIMQDPTQFHPDALRLVLQVTGVVPPGSRVQLADGREGTVLGPGSSGDAWRPLVLIDGQLVDPDARVTLRSVLDG